MKVVSKCPTSLRKKRSNSVSLAESMFKDQRSIANIRERQRTQNLNSAFENLKKSIPTLSTDKLSKIQTLKIAKAYIQFLNQQLIEEPVEKCQYQDELKRKFSIWRMENEQVTFDSPSNHVSIDQVTSSSDFLVKMEDYEKDASDRSPDGFDRSLAEKNLYDKDRGYEGESYENGSCEFDRNGSLDRDGLLKGAYVKNELFYKEAFEHKFTFVKTDDLINVIVDY